MDVTLREYPDRPVVGVGGIVIDGDRVLLVRRANEPLKGAWSVPGGAVELGETLEVAVAREVLEETGVVVEVGSVVEVLDRIRTDDAGRARFHYVLIDFLCRATGGVLACATDADAAQWTPLDRLLQLGVAGSTIAVIRKAAAMAESEAWGSRHARPAHDG